MAMNEAAGGVTLTAAFAPLAAATLAVARTAVVVLFCCAAAAAMAAGVTTTPNAILEDLHALTFGYALTPASRAMLGDWLAASHTGDAAIRAGIPADWRRAGKTGNGNELSNDIVVLFPSGNRPAILVAASYFNPAITGDARRGVLMEVGRAVAANFG